MKKLISIALISLAIPGMAYAKSCNNKPIPESIAKYGKEYVRYLAYLRATRVSVKMQDHNNGTKTVCECADKVDTWENVHRIVPKMYKPPQKKDVYFGGGEILREKLLGYEEISKGELHTIKKSCPRYVTNSVLDILKQAGINIK